jgi:hypothetical protein
MSKESTVRIQICSDSTHDRLIAEIYVRDKFVALLSQENGLDNIRIESPDECAYESAISRSVELKLFMEAVNMAKRKLIDRMAYDGSNPMTMHD